MSFTRRVQVPGVAAAALLFAAAADAQLADYQQIAPHGVPGGQINKTLQEQIGAGRGDEFEPGSSIYLIKRDPARSIRRGRQLFQRKFSLRQGLGPRVNPDSVGDIVENRAFGAGLIDSCAGCHGRPRGAAGFGGDVVTRPDSRDAPHLFGLGLQEMLADEITAELRSIRDRAVSEARARRTTVTLELGAKGISYGRIRASSRGNVDTSHVRGVDPDLRVRPFFAQGGTISMREFAVGAFGAEMGLQAVDPLLCAVTDPTNPTKQTSPAGFVYDPSKDDFERPPACSVNEDPDDDGVRNEIDGALIDYIEFYLLNYFRPGTGPGNSRTRDGLKLMRFAGCTTCHVQNLVIEKDRRVADVETVHDPVRGIFNRLFATATPQFVAQPDSAKYPKLLPLNGRFVVANIFADFKRHDLGPNFHEREYDGQVVTEFMTEPLWGVGTSAPYGHDGRSMNIEEAILRHGGEAKHARDRFAALPADYRARVLEFLNTLILFPPDDTASNLNPGVPGTSNPQDPSEHGSINLGALFQIPEEGAE